jgi:hypothetical protein
VKISGVDYNFGRFDNHEHRIVDVEGNWWWGIDYYVPHIMRPDQTLDPGTFFSIFLDIFWIFGDIYCRERIWIENGDSQDALARCDTFNLKMTILGSD